MTSLLADRSSRRDVMVQATLMRSACLALIAGAVALGAPFALVLALAAVFTIASTAIKPAQAALLPTLARSPEQLAVSNAVLTGIDNAGFLVGAIAGGSLIAATSPELAFAVTAAVCLLAAFLIHRIRTTRGRRTASRCRARGSCARRAPGSTPWPASRSCG